jgi:two-component system phosphate regulon sensor histidine kinase PhoR
MKNLLNAFPLASFIVGTDGYVTGANGKAFSLFGKDIIGRTSVEVVRNPNVSDAIEEALKQKIQRHCDWSTTQATTDIVYHVTASWIEADEILVTFQDITDIEQSLRARREFVTNVSHELKTPLTAMLGFLETLQLMETSEPEAQQRFLGMMQQETQRMNRLVSDLLSLNSVQANERIRPSDPIDLGTLIENVVANLQGLATQSQTQLIFTPPQKAPVVFGDGDQLRQVAINLIENAIKYARSADIHISLSDEAYQPMLRREGIVLTVEDHGPGIAAIHIPRLTERFYRVDDHRGRDIGGTGLGLSIVKHIVSRHRGRMLIKSTLGHGSQFFIYLPKN